MIKLKCSLIIGFYACVAAQAVLWPMWIRVLVPLLAAGPTIFVGVDAEMSGRRTLWVYPGDPMPVSEAREWPLWMRGLAWVYVWVCVAVLVMLVPVGAWETRWAFMSALAAVGLWRFLRVACAPLDAGQPTTMGGLSGLARNTSSVAHTSGGPPE